MKNIVKDSCHRLLYDPFRCDIIKFIVFNLMFFTSYASQHQKSMEGSLLNLLMCDENDYYFRVPNDS